VGATQGPVTPVRAVWVFLIVAFPSR